jgi:hypothetical protein
MPHPPNKTGVHGEVDYGFVVGCVRCFSGSEELVLQTDKSSEEAAQIWEGRFLQKENDGNSPHVEVILPVQAIEPELVEHLRNHLDNDNIPDNVPPLLDEVVGNVIPLESEWKHNFDKISSIDPAEQILGTQFFRKCITVERNPPIDRFINLGLIPLFVNFLKDDNNQVLQFEVCWLFTNISNGNSDQCESIVNSGALPILIQLLRSTSVAISKQAAWALTNVGAASVDNRDKLLHLNALNEIVEVGKEFNLNSEISLVRIFSFATRMLCGSYPQPILNVVIAIPLLFQWIHMYDDPKTLSNICNSCVSICNYDNDRVKCIIDSGIVSKMVQLMAHVDDSIVAPALHTIGNLAAGSDADTQVIVDLHAVPELLRLLDHNNSKIRKKSAWVLSNISGGSQSQLQSVIDAKVFPKIISILDNNNIDAKLIIEILWIIKNAFLQSIVEQRIYLLKEKGLVGNLIKYLSLIQDNKITTTILETLKHILEISIRINKIDEILLIFSEFDCLNKLNFDNNDCSCLCDEIRTIIESKI